MIDISIYLHIYILIQTDKGEAMNKKTVALEMSDYRKIIECMVNGFTYTDTEGKEHKFRKNRQLAMICQTEASMGLRISDILNLKLDSIRKDGGRYALNIVEQKTQKARNFTVPKELYIALRDYADDNSIKKSEPLFQITERAAQKQLKIIADYLGIEGISTHSFRKCFARNAYESNDCDIELVRQLLQHSSTTVTQRYIGVSTKRIEAALQGTVDTFLFA